jgi:hypothetical protein
LSEIVPQLQVGPQAQMYFPFRLTDFTGLPHPHLPGCSLLRSQVQFFPHRQKIPTDFSMVSKCIGASSIPHRHFPGCVET